LLTGYAVTVYLIGLSSYIVGELEICEATAEVVSCSAVATPTATVSLQNMVAVRIASVGIEYCTPT